MSRLSLVAVALLAVTQVACVDDGGNEESSSASSASSTTSPADEALVARAKSFELPTKWIRPPGDPLHHHTAGFAKILCSAVFITGLDADFAAENIGYFSSDYDERSKVTNREIDTESKMVHLTLADGVVRTAKYLGDQGCVTLPLGEDELQFEPVDVKSSLPDPDGQPWPMGDVLPNEPFPAELEQAKVRAAVDAAFEPLEGMTAAFVVTWRGQIIGERYRDGLDLHSPLESWSMGKSLTATLMGILIRQGVYDLWEPAPVPEWQGDGDPRAEIRIADILRMSSGIRCVNRGDPEYDHCHGDTPTISISIQVGWTRSNGPRRGPSSGRRIRSGATGTVIPS